MRFEHFYADQINTTEQACGHMAAQTKQPVPTEWQHHVELLYLRHAEPLERFLTSRCGSADTAQEVTATVFECVAKTLAADPTVTIEPAWLYTVAKRRLVDRYRFNERQSHLIDRIQRSQPGTVDRCQDDVLTEHEVAELLSGLAPNQRAALAYRYLVDLPVVEVAHRMGVTFRAAESMLGRARTKLRHTRQPLRAAS